MDRHRSFSEIEDGSKKGKGGTGWGHEDINPRDEDEKKLEESDGGGRLTIVSCGLLAEFIIIYHHNSLNVPLFLRPISSYSPSKFAWSKAAPVILISTIRFFEMVFLKEKPFSFNDSPRERGGSDLKKRWGGSKFIEWDDSLNEGTNLKECEGWKFEKMFSSTRLENTRNNNKGRDEKKLPIKEEEINYI